MLPSPAELRYFIEVANTLNISRASERLGISQPTLSLAIQRLEENFGMPLLVRNKNGVMLTKAGQKLLSHARNLSEEWERIKQEALRMENEIGGRYTIGCHVSVALYALPSFLPTLMAENPSLELKLLHDLSRKITEDVVSFKIDFGIVVNPVEHPDLVIRQLYKDEVLLWTKPGFSPTTLICDPDLLQTQSILRMLSKAGIEVKRMITSPSLEVITTLTAAKTGIGILPRRVATRDKTLGLKPFPSSGPKVEDRICLIYRADAQNSYAGRAISAAIESCLGSPRVRS